MGARCCSVFSDSSGLGCCMDMDAYRQVELAEIVPNAHRHCTDVPCCLVIVAAILVEIIILISSWQSGANPHLMTDGYDYNLNMCELVVWPSISHYDIRICIPEDESCNVFTNDANNKQMIDIYPSKQFLNSYCIPQDLNELTGTDIESNFDSVQQTLEHALLDLNTTKWLLVIMSFTAVLCSFIYIKIIAYIGRFLVWFTALIVIGFGGVLAYYLIANGIEDMDNAETKTAGQWMVGIGCAVIVILIILILIIWFERKNVKLVIEMLNESSHALNQLPLTLCTPIYFSFFALLLSFAFALQFAYIYSVKIKIGPNPMPQEFIDNGNYPEEYWYLSFDPVMEGALIWHTFIWLYFIQCITYLGFMTLAGVFADWYFSEWRDERHKKKQLKHKWPICTSFIRILRFHLGSIAFASLILTIIRAMRATVNYIEGKVAGSTSPIGKCCFSCIKCCLWCCQWIFDKINKNGLIFITIYGNSFCYASYSSFKLILQNIEASIMVGAVATASEILGKFTITLGLTAISIICMNYIEYYKNTLSSYLFPALIILIITYIVSALFMSVFEVAVETIYLSYLIDEKVHGNAIFSTGEFTKIKKREESIIDHNISSDQHDVDDDDDDEHQYLTTAV